MTSDAARWDAPRPTTTSPQALRSYHDGVAALVAGSGDAERLLDAAVEADPGFLLGRVALAVARVDAGAPYEPPGPSNASRGERQHAEVVRATLLDDPCRGQDLRREHLLEFPGDVLVVWLPVLRRRPRAP